MGTNLTKEQKNVLEVFCKILKEHGKKMDNEELQRILIWASKNDPSINSHNINDPEIWDKVGVRLWDCATRNDKIVAGLLPSWRIIFETLKVHVGSRAEEGEEKPTPPSAPPLPTPPPTDCVVRPRVNSRKGVSAILSPNTPDDDPDDPFDLG